jgi:hypothetical protein
MAPPGPETPTAQRLRPAGWLNGRSALGVLLVVVAVLAGALLLQRAQRLVPVYEAARDLPSGARLSARDLALVRVRLPVPALRRYAQPNPRGTIVGQILTAPLRQHMLIPVDGLASSPEQTDMVELPIKVASGDMAQGLRPGDHVQVLAAYGDGVRSGQARLLLSSVEVVRVLEEPSGLAASRQSGVQVRMPSDRTALVVGAIASARVFVVKASAPGGGGAGPATEAPDAAQDWSQPSTPQAPPSSTDKAIPGSLP